MTMIASFSILKVVGVPIILLYDRVSRINLFIVVFDFGLTDHGFFRNWVLSVSSGPS